VRSFPVVVVDEFPVEWESVMFQVVGAEPSFDLSLRGGFPDAAHDVFNPLLLAVPVEA